MIDPDKKLFRWGPLDAAVLPLGYSIEASFDLMKDLFGICWPESFIIFDHDQALWILESESVAKTSHDFTEKVILSGKDKAFYELWKSKVLDLNNIQEKITDINFTIFNNDELDRLLKAWSQIYLNFWAVGMTAELINYSLEFRLKASIKNKLTDERDINEAFALLSTPSKLSFYKEEEMDLMEIALLKGTARDERLKLHQKKYSWIYNNYLNTKELDNKYFSDQIKHTQVTDADEFLKEFSEYESKINQQKKKLASKLDFSTEEKTIVDSMNDSVIFQDERKKYNLIAASFLEKFLVEIAKRTNISVRDLKWLLPSEIEKILKNNDFEKLIEQRKYLAVILCSNGKTEIDVREKASKKKGVFEESEFDKSVNLQGTVASTSNNRYFRGTARIISSPKEGDKLKEGEILVTTMTTPDFVVLMKKAGAIITDVGGVTCHAAIVSREFGKPCIVGTNNATKFIKDGDILELHNLRGTVKIIPS